MKVLDQINSFIEFIQLTMPKGRGKYIYRGLSSIIYPLIPRVGRYYDEIKFSSKLNFQRHEKATFNLFMLKAKHLASYKFNEQYMIMALAQHHGITRRITVQKGVFTVHNDPTQAFDHPDLEQIPINRECRKEIKNALYEYGISRETLFPDLDGISQTINYLKFD